MVVTQRVCSAGTRAALRLRAARSGRLLARTARARRVVALAEAEDDDGVVLREEEEQPEVVDDGTVESKLSQATGKDSWLVGGFAGGEAGLKAFVEEEVKATKEFPYVINPAPIRSEASLEKEAKSKPSGRKPEPIGAGKDAIYVGKLKEPGAGKEVFTIKDDARLYPSRTPLTGGFAGGEIGLKEYFNEKGEIPIKNDKDASSQPPSPLIVAFGLGGATALGAILLDPITLRDEIVALMSSDGGDLSSAVGRVASGAGGSDGVDTALAIKAAGMATALTLGAYSYNAVAKATSNLVEGARRTAIKGLAATVFVSIALKIITS